MNVVNTLVARLAWRRPRLRVLRVTNRPARLEMLLVSSTIADATVAYLRAGGNRGCEEFAFWSGHVIAGRTGVVSRAFHPRTTQGRGHVLVDDDDQLLAMTDLIHEHDELVLCQLHTHPRDAFHSSADDQGAFTDEVGFLSLVLPSFGAGGMETAEAFLRAEQGWLPEGQAIATGLVRVFGDILHYDGAGWDDN